MVLLEEIKQFFASTYGAANLTSLPEEYPAYGIRKGDDFGVAVKWDRDEPISEHFANARLYTETAYLSGKSIQLLMLTMDIEEYRNEFASVCAQFVDPGKDGEDRKKLIENPVGWWDNWKNLLGNAVSNKPPYSVLCELVVLNHVRSFDPTAEWTASTAGTHDIESDHHSYEVKSTIKRYGSTVTISGQFQLLTPKPLDLFFIRIEESPVGISINDVRDDLVKNGYDQTKLEKQLARAGYELGASARNKKYAILEKRVYVVDDAFPKITEKSFKGDAFPNGGSQLKYTIDLEVPAYTKW